MSRLRRWKKLQGRTQRKRQQGCRTPKGRSSACLRQAGCATCGEEGGHVIPAAARNLRCRAPAKGGTREETRSRAKARPLQTLRAELACGEIFQGAKTAVEFGRGQAAQAVEGAQKIRDRTVALARVAFETAGNQVAVGIASETHAWHDVVEALYVGGSAAETIKASAAFAIVNGLAECPS